MMLLHAACFHAALTTAVSRCNCVTLKIENCMPNYAPIRFGGYLASYTKAPYRRPSTVLRESAFTLADRSTVVGGPGACHSRDRRSGEVY